MTIESGITPLGRRVADIQGMAPTRSDRAGAPADAAVGLGAATPPDPSLLGAVVSGINELVHELQRELHFAVDNQTGETVVKVVDRATDEVVRQIPSEEVLRLRQRLAEMTGVLFDGSA